MRTLPDASRTMASSVLLALALALAPAHVVAIGSTRAQAPVVVGRVRVTPLDEPSPERVQAIERLLTGRFIRAAAGGAPPTLVVSVGADPGAPTLYRAVIYDYAAERGFDLTLDEAGAELARRPLDGQPALAREEPERAQAIVTESPPWSKGLANGSLRLYAPMPPVSSDARGRRWINVGIVQAAASSGASPLPRNEIVSVHIPSAEIRRHPGGAPATSAASAATCGPAPQTSCVPVQSCGSSYQIDWPSTNPIWSLKVRHPFCTRSVQPDATGIELRDITFRGNLVLSRAELPVLNVKYQGNTCGPYRDWLWEEDCFQAAGTDVAPGIRVTTGSPPTTFCESGGVDQGNFRGVAVHDEGSSLWLVTEAEAGWYRYHSQWRFHADGTIEPIFSFGGVENSCTCQIHLHHAYWRFEFALDGVSGDPATGIATAAWQRPGTPGSSVPIPSEGSFYRSTSTPENDWLRIENPQTGTAWILMPSARDGSAQGDSYAKRDVWALAENPGEINDPNLDTSIRLDPWINGEALGASKRLVLWYRGGWSHDDPSHETACGFAGPRLVPAGLDSDADNRTVGDGDCDDGNPLVWWTPAEVNGLVLSHDRAAAITQLQWPPPAGGATTPLYDSLRSSNPADFTTGGTCIESDGQDTLTTDGSTPAAGSAFYYLVRAKNSCPSGLGQGPLGNDSAGQERSGRPCP
jgi:hypothetical protein